MYKSLTKWATQPFKLVTTGKKNGAGEVTESSSLDLKCARFDKLTNVINIKGVEVVSKTVLYIDIKHNIKMADFIELDGIKCPIISICRFPDGSNGIQEVYI